MSKFTEKVLEVVNKIPKGTVASYGQVSLIAGIPRAALQVGWILHQYGETTPWWRVINNAGRISTKCIEHHASLQKKHLEAENVKVTPKLKIDIEKYRWRPNPNELKKLKLDEKYLEEVLNTYSL
ncbi:MGMT family protein [Patescibacteria group bacterium]|nr:MGMT family protein [Patescibacteria group bacterium]